MPSTGISAQGTQLFVSTGSSAARTVTGLALGFPTIVTAAAHGFANGDVVTFAALGGNTQLNGLTLTVKNVTTNTFAVDVNTTGGAAYTTGGTATGATYTEVKNLKSITPPAQAATELDISNLDSLNKETIPGLVDPGTITFPVDVDYGDAGQNAVRAAQASGATKSWKYVLPNGKTVSFNGWVKKFDTGSAKVDAVSQANMEIRLTTIATVV